MAIGEICNRDVVIAQKHDSLLEIAQLMRSQHVGSVVIVEDADGSTKPVGIITDRDLVIEVLAPQADAQELMAGDVMSFDLVVGRESDGIWETMLRMRQHGIRRIPIVDDKDSLLGILSVDDFIELFANELNDLVKIITQEQHHEQVKRK